MPWPLCNHATEGNRTPWRTPIFPTNLKTVMMHITVNGSEHWMLTNHDTSYGCQLCLHIVLWWFILNNIVDDTHVAFEENSHMDVFSGNGKRYAAFLIRIWFITNWHRMSEWYHLPYSRTSRSLALLQGRCTAWTREDLLLTDLAMSAITAHFSSEQLLLLGFAPPSLSWSKSAPDVQSLK